MVAPTVGVVGEGGGAAVGDGARVASLWAGGVLVSVRRTSMMKRMVGAGGVLLGASGMGVSEWVAVGALGVGVSQRRLSRFEKRKREGRRRGRSSELTERTTEEVCFVSLTARLSLRYRAAPIVTYFTLWRDFLMKSKSWSSSSGRMWVGIE